MLNNFNLLVINFITYYNIFTLYTLKITYIDMKDNNYIKSSTLSLADLENMDNEILERIAGDLDNSKTVSMAHSSHSSSSGRGHSSYVSGSAAKKDAE
jgi:hypothetical protein